MRRVAAVWGIACVVLGAFALACGALIPLDEYAVGADGSAPSSVDGAASSSCPPGNKLCSGKCVAVGDPSFGCLPDTCDPCSAGAGATSKCGASGCEAACAPGFFDCDAGAPGCETPQDLQHCGGCNDSCTSTEVCDTQRDGGTCATSCAGGATLCSNTCVDTNTNVSHCGGCGRVCTSPGTVPSCVGGNCVFACAPGFSDCDGNKSNGCECAAPGYCEGNTCATCIANGADCQGGGLPCCGSNTCTVSFFNKKVCCKQNNFACSLGSECCSGHCDVTKVPHTCTQ